MAKPLTAWAPQSGLGYRIPQTGVYIQDNLGNLLVDNLGNYFVPNPYYNIGKYATAWTGVTKTTTSWTVN